MFETKVVDNFFDTPSLVRQYALQQHFYNRPGNYPGLRTSPINELNYEYYYEFVKKLVSIYYDINSNNIEWDVKTLFQWANNQHKTGWIHQDDINYYDVAGVIYLTPDAPLNCGTSIYKPKIDIINEYTNPTDPFKINQIIDENYINDQNRYNSQFEKVQSIDNVYNRLVVYDCHQWHAQDGFFGTNVEDSRLIQVFFARIRLC
jgi:hypothetical protein